MSEVILKVENVSKQYRLGLVGTGSIKDDLKRWWYQLKGKEDPFLKIGDTNDRSKKGKSDYVWALKDINFEVNKGEVLGIIGKNGAGKSTLLKILSKITSPTTGSIKFNGRIASLLEVGTGFHPELTGKENVYLNGAILGMSKAEISAKYDEIVDFSGCERYIDTPVKRYSSGMTVRLAFAVAAFLEPDILIIDEVLAVGDAEFQKKAIGKMQDISKGEGRTVLFVSHNMAAVRSLCTRGVVLEDGMVVFEGDSNESINYYLNKEKKILNKDLSLLKNRVGDGKVKFIEFYIENEQKVKVESVLTGDFVNFCFKLRAENISHISSEIDLGFSIHNIEEELITVLYSSYQNKLIKIDNDGYYTVKCRVEDFSLNQGEYVINGRILCNNEESDWLKEPLGKINIVKGDYYKTGNTGFNGNTKFLIKGKWQLEN